MFANTLPTANCKSIGLKLRSSACFGQKISSVLFGWNILDDDALAIFHSEMRAKPVVPNGKVLGSWGETRRICSCKQFTGPVVFENSADGGYLVTIRKVELAADLLQQSSHVDQTAHTRRERAIYSLSIELSAISG